jgi:L-gulonolactone oxidase
MPATWRNWGRIASAQPHTVLRPGDAEEVADAVIHAGRVGATVRAVGAGHSFTPIAATDSVHLHLDRLTGLRGAPTTTGEVTVGAGTRLADVPGLLAPYGLAMENLGDIDRQTVAGAISTGTHGTGLTLPGLSAQVSGVRVVLADGRITWADATHDPDLFAAARLGLGAFGIVTEIRLRCVREFLLAADEHPEPLADLVADFPARAAAVDHLEFYFFPHTDVAVVKQNTRLPAAAARSPRSPARAWFDDEFTQNVVFGAVCAVGTAAPPLVPGMNRLAARAMSRSTYTDASTAVFTTSRRVRFREMEYGIDLPDLGEAIGEIRALIRRAGWRISFPLEVRVAAADDVPLSTAYGRPTAYIAVHRYVRRPFAEYFLAVERILLAHGGRPHWGKLHTLAADRVRPRYPLFDRVAETRRRVDPQGIFANAYIRRVLGG